MGVCTVVIADHLTDKDKKFTTKKWRITINGLNQDEREKFLIAFPDFKEEGYEPLTLFREKEHEYHGPISIFRFGSQTKFATVLLNYLHKEGYRLITTHIDTQPYKCTLTGSRDAEGTNERTLIVYTLETK